MKSLVQFINEAYKYKTHGMNLIDFINLVCDQIGNDNIDEENLTDSIEEFVEKCFDYGIEMSAYDGRSSINGKNRPKMAEFLEEEINEYVEIDAYTFDYKFFNYMCMWKHGGKEYEFTLSSKEKVGDIPIDKASKDDD